MSRAATASFAAWVNESGRLARSVATATQRPVIRSWRSWGRGKLLGNDAKSEVPLCRKVTGGDSLQDLQHRGG